MQALKSFFAERKHPKITRVEASDHGLTVWSNDRTRQALEWSSIEKIFTYKVDCYAYDSIWLAFVVGKNEIHIHEEADGFEQLVQRMLTVFPSVDREWYATVMQPPFAENLIVLYQR